MVRRITAAALILVAACSGRSVLGSPGKSLSYAQYRSLEAGMAAQTILNAFGPAGNVFEQDGKVRGLAYACEDAAGQILQLRMVFTADEKLEKWILRDPKAPEPAAEAPPAGK